MRHVGRLHEVGEAHGRAIATSLAGDQVHDPLDDEYGLRLAGAAVRRHRHAIGVDAVEGDVHGGDPVRTSQHRGAQERHHQTAWRVGAGVVHEAVTQREQAALIVEADLHRVDLGALLRGCQHVLEAILEPPHRAAETSRQQRDQHVFGIDDQLGAEAAADVGRQHAHAMRLEREQIADELAHLVGDLGRRPHRQEPGHRVVLGDEPSRLHGLATGAADAQGQARPARCRLQRGRDVAARESHAAREVVGDVVVHARRPRSRRLLRRRQRLPGDVDQRARILRGVASLGDHDRDSFADEARAVAGEEGEVLAGERRVGRHDRQWAHGVVQIGERHHAHHAGRLRRALGVDRADAGVGVWAAEDGGVEHARQRDVAGVAPTALHETRVLLAEEPVADELHRIARPCPGADGRTSEC